MPCVMTDDWLTEVLPDEINSDVNPDEMEAVLNGYELGSVAFWKEIYKIVKPVKMSFDSEENICELKFYIEEYGEDYPCNLYYIEKDNTIIFKDFLTSEDMKEMEPEDIEDLKQMNFIKTTLKKALEYFEFQNKIS